jgi:hypothetical protein
MLIKDSPTFLVHVKACEALSFEGTGSWIEMPGSCTVWVNAVFTNTEIQSCKANTKQNSSHK